MATPTISGDLFFLWRCLQGLPALLVAGRESGDTDFNVLHVASCSLVGSSESSAASWWLRVAQQQKTMGIVQLLRQETQSRRWWRFCSRPHPPGGGAHRGQSSGSGPGLGSGGSLLPLPAQLTGRFSRFVPDPAAVCWKTAHRNISGCL